MPTNRRLNRLADDARHGLYPDADADARRLGGRIGRRRDHLFTFLDQPHVPFDNNRAGRQVWPAAVRRKDVLCNGPAGGAETRAVRVSIFRTLRLRGHDPTKTIAAALRERLRPANYRHWRRKPLQTGDVLRMVEATSFACLLLVIPENGNYHFG